MAVVVLPSQIHTKFSRLFTSNCSTPADGRSSSADISCLRNSVPKWFRTPRLLSFGRPIRLVACASHMPRTASNCVLLSRTSSFSARSSPTLTPRRPSPSRRCTPTTLARRCPRPFLVNARPSFPTTQRRLPRSAAQLATGIWTTFARSPAGVQPLERWDQFKCRICGPYEYRHRDRKLRAISS